MAENDSVKSSETDHELENEDGLEVGSDPDATFTIPDPGQKFSVFTRIAAAVSSTPLRPGIDSGTVRLMYATTAAFAVTGSLALVGGFVTARADFGLPLWGSVLVGVFFAAVILALDYATIATLHHLEPRGRTAMVVLRLIVAMAAGFTISDVLVIQIYSSGPTGGAIGQQVRQDAQAHWSRDQSTYARDVNDAKAGYNQAQTSWASPAGYNSSPQYQALSTANAQVAQWTAQLAAEASGKGGSLTYGVGPVAQFDKAQLDSAKAAQAAAQAAADAELSSLRSADGLSAARTHDLQAKVAAAQANFASAKARDLNLTGLLAKQDALYELIFSSFSTFINYVALAVLLVGIDTAPVLLKATRRTTLYEDTTEQQENRKVEGADLIEAAKHHAEVDLVLHEVELSHQEVRAQLDREAEVRYQEALAAQRDRLERVS